MPDIGTDKNRLRTVRLDAAVKLQNQLVVRKGAVPVLVDLQQGGIILRLHPQVKVLGGVIGQLHKKIAYPTGIAILPQGQLLLQQTLIGMVFAVQVDLADLLRSGHGRFRGVLRLLRLAAAGGGQCQQYHSQQKRHHSIQIVNFHSVSPCHIRQSRFAFLYGSIV